MRPMNLIPAATALVLALAAGTSAAPISPAQSFGSYGANWAVPTDFPPRPDFWGYHHGHRPHATGLQTLLLKNGYGGQEVAEDPRDQNGEEADADDADGSPTAIAADLNVNPQPPMVPAVPEPGSLALLGAGALGLLAARAVLKKT